MADITKKTYVTTPFIQELQLLIIIIIIINGGILSLTDSHHHHHGQNPTMVGICHGGNVLGNRCHHDFIIFFNWTEILVVL